VTSQSAEFYEKNALHSNDWAKCPPTLQKKQYLCTGFEKAISPLGAYLRPDPPPPEQRSGPDPPDFPDNNKKIFDL